MLTVVAKSIVEANENKTYILYSRLHICTQLHQEWQVISFEISYWKGNERFSVVLHELCQVKLVKSYLAFVYWLWIAAGTLLLQE